MRKFLLGFLVILAAVVVAGCPWDSDSGSGKQPREFYIEDYTISPIYYWCWYGLDQPHTGGVPADAGAFEESEVEVLDRVIPPETEDGKMYIFQPGRGYQLTVEYFNDQDNTTWVAFEIFVDGEKQSSSGAKIIPFRKEKEPEVEGEGSATILLLYMVPWNWEGKEVQVDVWVEDENGVKSEVFTFDVAVIQLWYPADSGGGS